jgi:hypothetical protein
LILFSTKTYNYSQSKQIFGYCDVSNCDVFDKTRAHFPPFYLMLDNMAVSKVRLGSKGPSYKKIYKALFRHFVWEIVKAPATSIALPL